MNDKMIIFVAFLGVIGLLQSALPYILVSYSLKFLPISLIGVFMVTSPWWSALFERIPKVKVRIFYINYQSIIL